MFVPKQIAKNILLITLILTLAIFLYPLDPEKDLLQYRRTAYSSDEGLPQNSVFAITQTREGYLWLGTQEGLVRFNGIEFDLFDRHKYELLSANYITVLAENKQGELWIGTEGGGVVSYQNNTFKTRYAKDTIGSLNVTSLLIAADQSLWIGTEKGLFRASGQDIEDMGKVAENPNTLEVSQILEDRSGTIWVGTRNKGLLSFKKNGNRYTGSPVKTGITRITALLLDHNDILWLGTIDSGVIGLAKKKPIIYDTSNGLSGDRVTCLHQDSSDNIWIGTYGRGLNRLSNGRLSKYDNKHPQSLNTIHTIFKDREGHLWIGTHTAGLIRLKDMKIDFYSKEQGLVHDSSGGILEDSQGRIWICSQVGGITMIQGGKKIKFTRENGLPSNNVYSVCEDKQGQIWFGTLGGGVSVYWNGRFKNYSSDNGLLSNMVRTVYADRQGRVWIGTYGRGLNYFEKGKFKAYTTENGLSHNRISSLFEDSHGFIWAGTIGGGLNRINKGEIKIFTTVDGIGHDNIFCFYEDKQQILWIATMSGLSRFKNNKFANVSKKNGLFDDLIFTILEDDKNNLWLSCNNGIFKVAKSELNDFFAGKIKRIHPRAFGKEDGMPSKECNGVCQPAGMKDRMGRLWFPTLGGVAIIDPANIRRNTIPPSLVFEEIVINGKKRTVNRNLNISPGKGNVEIKYVGLSFEGAKKNRYKYKLEGFETEYNQVGTRRTAYYTNIPAGEYTFRVTSCNNDGVWNPNGISIGLSLQPFFYQTWWFYAIVGLLLVSAGPLFYNFRLKNLKKKKHELEKLVAIRTRELKEASLSDPLTGLRNRRYITEVLNTDITAFVNFKKYLLSGETRRAAPSRATVFGVFLFDIDHFKDVNDTYGHDAGDHILTQFSDILKLSVRADDVVIRWGGEEFLVILKKAHQGYLPEFAAKIRQKVEKAEFTLSDHGGKKINKTCSVGYVGFPFYNENPDFLDFHQTLMLADLGLYYAKENGRNLAIQIKPTENLPGADQINDFLNSLDFALKNRLVQIKN